MSETLNSRIIHALPEDIYLAFTNPEALATWLAPGNMIGKVHRFDPRVGGGYEMSLYYSDNKENRGKTLSNEDRFTAKFVKLVPSKQIVQAIHFNTDNPAYSGEMIMDTTFEKDGGCTKVTIHFSQIPPGIDPNDNEKGTELSLDKLQEYVENR